MKKKLLTITLTALLILSTVALGFSTVFRVKSVTLVANLAPNSQISAEILQAELKAEYKEDGTFSVNDKKARKIVKGYPRLRVTGFEKSYPSSITITVTEDSETYAVEAEGGYYILSADGVVMEFRSEANGEGADTPNVLLKGLQVTGEVGASLYGDYAWQTMLILCNSVDLALDGICRNIVSAEVYKRTPETFYMLTTVEGVKIYVSAPDRFTSEKGEAAIDLYKSLEDGQRMRGYIYVSVEGVATYNENNLPE